MAPHQCSSADPCPSSSGTRSTPSATVRYLASLTHAPHPPQPPSRAAPRDQRMPHRAPSRVGDGPGAPLTWRPTRRMNARRRRMPRPPHEDSRPGECRRGTPGTEGPQHAPTPSPRPHARRLCGPPATGAHRLDICWARRPPRRRGERRHCTRHGTPPSGGAREHTATNRSSMEAVPSRDTVQR